jgi:beta-glucanase (GH16 family)
MNAPRAGSGRRPVIAKTLSALLFALLASCTAVAPERPKESITTVVLPAAGAAREPARESGWQLSWSDEFDGIAIDRARWGFDVDCWGGGNEERQCYTNRAANAAVEGGALVITARKENYTGPALPPHLRAAVPGPAATATKPFTSARMVTRGRAAWRYGRIEVRAKLPTGQGTWPAIWMLPEEQDYGAWAASGEIDILEAVNLGVPCAVCPGGRENTILGTLHFGGRWPYNAFNSTETHAPDVLDGFHTFGIIWVPGRIDWTYDGRVYASKRSNEWWTAASDAPDAPFDRPFHLIINLSVGGGLAEERGMKGVDESGYPKTMRIDWVRVWQCIPQAANARSCKGNR